MPTCMHICMYIFTPTDINSHFFPTVMKIHIISLHGLLSSFIVESMKFQDIPLVLPYRNLDYGLPAYLSILYSEADPWMVSGFHRNRDAEKTVHRLHHSRANGERHGSGHLLSHSKKTHVNLRHRSAGVSVRNGRLVHG